ncbi:type I restriction-modification system subunit M [Desulfovibrio subterraneus]|uniref:site-specific DNA-methyltransferase (adenine-specific) n=1 Tax=Desulfovibrio subterraneus TaxID=2718620 RepID=A0A7J0BKF6_9BACT|nr:type I restriction-modification system subunit M [Desulfovibrio subterraneus]GFM33721.1 type I restriction endonuclease [Desulfovibrio subterraneus]
MNTTTDIVQQLWKLCNTLWGDGVTYHQYVNELTYLLFLKMAEETQTEHQIPEEYRWKKLVKQDGVEQLVFYKKMLIDLGTSGSKLVQDIFANATSFIQQPKNLRKLVESIDKLDWYSAREEGLGDLYEGLLEKNATESKRGAGQYFTPRRLIESMVDLMQPKPGEIIQDPAVGTGGFLINADRYIKERTDDLFTLKEHEQNFQRREAFQGIELVQDVHRLCLMNLMLHGVETPVFHGDTLGPQGASMAKADLILTNPPFGTATGGGHTRRDDFTYPTNNRQLAFLQHIYRGLKPGGRAAVVLPDNVLFEDNTGRSIRTDLMEKCNLHTILRLPTGIFYAQGVKTNVLFFQRGETDKGNTKATWFYDLRTNMPSFGKRTPLTRAHFAEFEACYGDDPNGNAQRVDQGEEGRFRCFTREDVAKRNDNLDITWLRDENADYADDLPEPEVLAAEIMEQLGIAMQEMEELKAMLEKGEAD